MSQWLLMGGRGQLAFAVIAMAAGVCLDAAPESSPTWRSRIGSRLLAVYDGRAGTQSVLSAASGASGPGSSIAVRVDPQGRVQLDVHYDCSRTPPAQELQAAGFSSSTSVRLATFCVLEGWAAPSALPAIAIVAGVTRVDAPAYALRRRPPAPVTGNSGEGKNKQSAHSHAAPQSAIDANAVTIMRADQFVAQTKVGGLGVTVGVQSTGVASLSVIQQRNELPAVRVVGTDSAALAGDEGTVLLEEVHAVAPSAGLAFCGPNTFVEYVACLGQLIGVGASILVDDIEFPPADLMSTDSANAQAVEQVLAQNPSVLMFTAAGNANGSYWEGTYAPITVSSVGIAALSCAANGSTRTDSYVESFDGTGSQQLTVTSSSTFPIVLTWSDPSGKNTSNFDLYWHSNSDSKQTGCLSAAGSASTLLQESLSLPGGSYTLRIGTPDASLTGKFLKLWIGGDGLTSISAPTAGSIVAPQAFAAGVLMVGAVNGSDGMGKNIETFSAVGPLSVLFPTPQQLQAPTFVAPDGIRVDAAGTYFEPYLFPDGNFYGTSASVPNAGAVAALLRSAFPQLSTSQVVSALQAGATVLGAGVPNMTFGYGRSDALGALGALPAPTLTPLPDATLNAGASSTPMSFSVTGTGTIHFTVTSSDASVVPASLVASGQSGVSISPANCGTVAMTCTLIITPAAGGASLLTLAAVDGANRAASATMHITVNGASAPPPAPTTSTAVPSHGGGGALQWWSLAILAAVGAQRRRQAQLTADAQRRAPLPVD